MQRTAAAISLVSAFVLGSAIYADAEDKPATPVLDPRFFGIVCQGKWSGMNSEVSIQVSVQNNKPVVIYKWGPGVYGSGSGRFPGGSTTMVMDVLDSTAI
jgi:hypothetical protein